MLDNNDIIKLSEAFATKDDLKKFALKADLIEFKDEILTGQDKILEELKAGHRNRRIEGILVLTI